MAWRGGQRQRGEVDGARVDGVTRGVLGMPPSGTRYVPGPDPWHGRKGREKDAHEELLAERSP